jgi:5-methylthioadenosine/S-adenosylhomocysteine deaminase
VPPGLTRRYFRFSADYFAFLSEFSRTHDLPFSIHMLETKTQRVLGQHKWGKSLIRHVHDLGHLDERVTVIHAIWVDDNDIALIPTFAKECAAI